MSSVHPLNPFLYDRLRRHFGPVKVSNEGQSLVARPVRGHGDEPRLHFVQDGEYYRVNCPYCGDNRQRLFVNHMFGQRDGWGRRMRFLAICFNEGCLGRPENWQDFIERLESAGTPLDRADVRSGLRLPEGARVVQWPGACLPLDQLHDGHPARAYLADRGFDPDEVARRFRVCYCTDSPYFLARHRLIIPVFEGEELKGWQARYVGELPWKDPARKRDLPVKYFSCPNSQFRSRCIYNWDRMKEWYTGVVCEGPTDVWRFGSMAGCIFGNTMTDVQRSRLLRVFRRRSLVLLLDPEEFHSRSTRQLVQWFDNEMPGRFCAVRLPEGTDPGSLEREFLREYVRAEAAAQGVRVRYCKERT
jgi:hypothetical protein